MSAKQAALDLIRRMPDDVTPPAILDELETLFESGTNGADEVAQDEWDSAWEAELALRAEAIRNGTAAGRPVDEVMRELRERFR